MAAALPSPAPRRLVPPALRLVRRAAARLGEGPADVGDGRTVQWIDILAGTVHRTDLADPTGAGDGAWRVGEVVGCAVPARDGRWWLGRRGDGAWWDPAAGTVAPAFAVEADRPDHRVNDGKADPAGRLWFGTISPRRGEASLYSWTPAEGLRRRLAGITVSNGLDWWEDERAMLYADSPTRRLVRMEWDPATGELGEPREWFDLEASGIPGVPDGLALDAAGDAWVAVWDGGCVLRIARDGTLREIFDLPVRRPTSVAFAGPGRRTLVVTSAGIGAEPGAPDRETAADGDLLAWDPGVAGRAPFRIG